MAGRSRDVFTSAWRFLTWAVVIAYITPVAHAEHAASYQTLKKHAASADKGTLKLNLDACRQTSGFTLKSSGSLQSPIVWSKLSMPATDNQIVFTSVNIVIDEDYTPLTLLTRHLAMPDDTVFVTMQTVSPKSFDPGTKVRTFQCRLGMGMSASF